MNSALAKCLRPIPGQPLSLGMGISLGLHMALAAMVACWSFAPVAPPDHAEIVHTVKLVELPPPKPLLPPPSPPEVRPTPPPPRPLPQTPPRVENRPPSTSRPGPVFSAAQEKPVKSGATGVAVAGEAIGSTGPPAAPASAGPPPPPVPVVDWSAYHGSVWGRIQRVKSYPTTARRKGWEGKALVAFVIDTRGEVKQVRLADSSGHALLDQEALDTVRRAAPYPTPPAAPPEGVRMEVAIVFELN